jgi:hypothetical protein
MEKYNFKFIEKIITLSALCLRAILGPAFSRLNFFGADPPFDYISQQIKWILHVIFLMEGI